MRKSVFFLVLCLTVSALFLLGLFRPYYAYAQSQTLQKAGDYGIAVSDTVIPAQSAEVSSIQAVMPMKFPDTVLPEINPYRPREWGPPVAVVKTQEARLKDSLPLIGTMQATGMAAQTLYSFDGLAYQGWVPLDTVGDVGPNHYVQMVNAAFAVFDKAGNKLTGPTDINQLWSGQGNFCEKQNDGDPIVLYDPLADRWLLSQFALPNGGLPPFYMCIAISITPDPTGKYLLYQFEINDAFPDYPKLGVWRDAYYMSTNDGFSSVGVYAFDRDNMLNGKAAAYQKFSKQGNFMLPADLDGATPPPVGSPNYFYTMMDDTYWAANGFPGVDRLEIWEFHADFALPANSSFIKTGTVPVAPFNYTVCGYYNLNCITQPYPGKKLDPVSEWPMWRLQYRNFGTYETLVGNFTVDTDGTGHAGIRWFELRRSSDSWVLHQEGTHAPDANHRWMGSLAMDGDGNIALGYSISGATLNPEIGYAVRLATDPLGTLQQESVFGLKGGVQSFSNRWGDYSSMNVDPTDDCTFWYTNAYVNPKNGLPLTRIGVFRMPSCIGTSATYTVTGTVKYGKNPLPGVTLSLDGPVKKTVATGTDGKYTIAGLIDGSYSLTPDKTGYVFVPLSSTINISGGDVTAKEFTAKKLYFLTVKKTGTGTGTITAAPEGINCGATCSDTYAADSYVKLTAAADESSSFSGWSETGCKTSKSCKLKITANKKVSAKFTLRKFQILSKAGKGGKIKPAYPVSVDYGGNKTYTISTEAGYQVAKVLVDGCPATLTTAKTYTFTNITGKHDISVVFKKK